MDHFDEWEILPRHGLLDYGGDHDGVGEEKSYGAKLNPKGVFNKNHFMCPSSPPQSRVLPSQVVPVPFQWEPVIESGEEIPKEMATKVPPDIRSVPNSGIVPEVKGWGPVDAGSKGTDQDSVSQVFFKKMKENEFVDMKMDSPKSNSKGFVPSSSPPIDAGKFSFEDKTEETKIGSPRIGSPRIGTPRIKQENLEEEELNWENDESTGSGMNLWKWSLTGIGAICTFGVTAAATVCFVILSSSHQKNKNQQHKQQLRFQIYAEDKSMKQVVQHATKLNEAISAMRGVPITRAHITFGGYCDGL